MKRLLIISPYFPPSNAADMQRIRMSLPYFKNFGWDAEVVCVNPSFSDLIEDEILLESVPTGTIIHQVKALPKKWTSKIGLGSIALRSIWYYRKKVNVLLSTKKFDLIYFSTTQFPVCILGPYWKKRFGVPYVIDMQDPWHSKYYENKSREERPPKYWLSYNLNKLLEPVAMRQVGGLISVSSEYIDDLKKRYVEVRKIPGSVVTFGAFDQDFLLTARHKAGLSSAFEKHKGLIDLVYVGRGGRDLHKALRIIFEGVKKGLTDGVKGFVNFRFHFIGTSYAPAGKGTATILSLAGEMGLLDYVTEDCNRLPYYQSLRTLQEADILIVPGSDDPKYTASKIFNFILARKPMLAVFSSSSSTFRIVKECSAGEMLSFDDPEASLKVFSYLQDYLAGDMKKSDVDHLEFDKYSSLEMTRKQCEVFDSVI